MRDRLSLLLAVLVAISVAVNIYLVRRGSAGLSAPPPTRDMASTTGICKPAGRSPKADTYRTTSPTVECPERLEQCADDLEVVAEELREFLPMPVHFERSTPNPKAEQRLRPDLDSMFDADKPEIVFECRGEVCKIEMLWEERDDEGDWHRTMQTGALRGKICGQGFHSGTPATDQLARKAVRLNTVYWKMCPPGVPGRPFAKQVWQSFLDSEGKARCIEKFPDDEATLDVRIDVATKDAGSSRIRLHIGGDLAVTDVGRCLSEVLEGQARAVSDQMPANVQPIVSYLHLRLPN